MKNKIKLFVFDMGEVVITNTFVITKVAIFLKISQGEFLFYASKAKLDLLQIGKINSTLFWDNFTKLSNINVTVDLFEKFFKPEKNRDMYDLINTLKKQYRVVCGTNTIESHYDFLKKESFYSSFDKIYASNKIGFAKPNREFFEYIIKKEGIKPEEIFFIDDDFKNIKSSEQMNINSFLFTNYDSLKDKLEYCELL